MRTFFGDRSLTTTRSLRCDRLKIKNLPLRAGSSLKAALDLNWDDPDQRSLALGMVLGVLHSVEAQLNTQTEAKDHPQVELSLSAARQVEQQDVLCARWAWLDLDLCRRHDFCQCASGML